MISPSDYEVTDLGYSTPCWIWRRSLRSNGYGRTKCDGKEVLVHRVSHEQFIGPIPEGFHVDHKCRNRACCNPDHLEAVRIVENVMRGKVGFSPLFCVRGHRRTVATLAAKGHCKICKGMWRKTRNEPRLRHQF